MRSILLNDIWINCTTALRIVVSCSLDLLKLADSCCGVARKSPSIITRRELGLVEEKKTTDRRKHDSDICVGEYVALRQRSDRIMTIRRVDESVWIEMTTRIRRMEAHTCFTLANCYRKSSLIRLSLHTSFPLTPSDSFDSVRSFPPRYE